MPSAVCETSNSKTLTKQTMKTQLIDRYGAASLQAELPQAPHGDIASLARRACSILHLRDRWKFVGWATLLALVAFALLFASVITHNDVLVLCSFVGFIGAFALVFRLRPAGLDGQVTQTESEMEKLTSAFDLDCQDAATRFAASALVALKHEAQNLVRAGYSLADLSKWKEETRDLYQSIESENANELTAHQDAVKNCREELQRKRKLLSSVVHGLKAKFIAGPARRVAREAVNAAAGMAEARIGEAVAKAQVRACHGIAEELSRNDSTDITVCTPPAPPRTPVWLGTPLPPAEVLKAEASELVESNINVLRSKND